MDMKKILQAFDSASSKPVHGASDMKKFVSIIKENAKPASTTVAEETISSFEEGTLGGDANAFLLAADGINDEVMGQIEKIKINADQELLKELLNKFNSFMSAYHAVGKEILQPDLFKDSMGENLNFSDYLNLEEAKQKGVDGKACWDGYKRMGTKKKGGKTVDNCVPTGKKK
jgi:hypothetical protein